MSEQSQEPDREGEGGNTSEPGTTQPPSSPGTGETQQEGDTGDKQQEQQSN
jgi:hypothetical protein